jgi:hypothetical protein
MGPVLYIPHTNWVSERCLQPAVLRKPLAGGYPIIFTNIYTKRGDGTMVRGQWGEGRWLNELNIVVLRKGRWKTILLRLQIHCAWASKNIIVAGCCNLGITETVAISTQLTNRVGLMHHTSVTFSRKCLLTKKMTCKVSLAGRCSVAVYSVSPTVSGTKDMAATRPLGS